MSETLDPSKSLRHLRSRTTKAMVFGLILAATGFIIYLAIEPSGRDATPTIYHHADGTFSLNRKDGPGITPDDVLECLSGYSKFGRVRLVSNPLTQLADWNAILNKAAEAGAADYQIEAGGISFTFTLPGGGIYAVGPTNLSATIINLGDMPDPPLDLCPGSDVVILAKSTTTCDEALKAAWDYLGEGKTITILSESLLLDHRKDRNEKFLGTFVKRRSDFWNAHIQPPIDRLNLAF